MLSCVLLVICTLWHNLHVDGELPFCLCVQRVQRAQTPAQQSPCQPWLTRQSRPLWFTMRRRPLPWSPLTSLVRPSHNLPIEMSASKLLVFSIFVYNSELILLLKSNSAESLIFKVPIFFNLPQFQQYSKRRKIK